GPAIGLCVNRGPNPGQNSERGLSRRRKAVAGEVEPYRPRGEAHEIDEGPSEEDIARFGDVTVRCRECGTELYDDVAVCWNCGRAVGGSDEAGGLPWWALVAAILAAAAMLFLLL